MWRIYIMKYMQAYSSKLLLDPWAIAYCFLQWSSHEDIWKLCSTKQQQIIKHIQNALGVSCCRNMWTCCRRMPRFFNTASTECNLYTLVLTYFLSYAYISVSWLNMLIVILVKVKSKLYWGGVVFGGGCVWYDKNCWWRSISYLWTFWLHYQVMRPTYPPLPRNV